MTKRIFVDKSTGNEFESVYEYKTGNFIINPISL